MELAVAEIRRVGAERWCVGITTCATLDDKLPDHPYFYPVYQEAQEHDLALCIHSGTDRPPHEALSDREFRVMVMLASGKTATEVADALCLSVKTISTYRSRALVKMNMRNNAEFAFYATKHGLIG